MLTPEHYKALAERIEGATCKDTSASWGYRGEHARYVVIRDSDYMHAEEIVDLLQRMQKCGEGWVLSGDKTGIRAIAYNEIGAPVFDEVSDPANTLNPITEMVVKAAIAIMPKVEPNE